MTATHLNAFFGKLTLEHACAHERALKVQLIQTPHEFEVRFADGAWHVID